jgi:hypothetical protein
MIDVAAWALIALIVVLLVVHRRLLAAIWWRTEDPRTVAVFRICVGALLLVHLVDLAPLLEWMYSSQGLATGEQARTLFGRGRWSLLYEFDSLAFVRTYAGLQWVVCAAFMLGFATPITKWLTWLLFMWMLARNGIDSGGDHVFAGFLFYLCLSRCGDSYSVDAWLRRRRDPTIAAHRSIPGWPRNLMLLQMIPMLCDNGLAKTGDMWRDGDMFYYALNRPFGSATPSWEVSALFGTNLFRVMTWGIHAFEILFPLAIVGLVIEFARRHESISPTPANRWLTHGLYLAIGIDCIALAYWKWGFDLHLPLVLTVLAGLAIGGGPLTIRLVRRMPEAARRWLLGPVVWAAILALFGALLLFVVRIGEWTGVTMCSAILLFEGDVVARTLARVVRRPVQPTGPTVPLSSKPLRRGFIALLSGLHVLAITATLLPHAKPIAPWRVLVERPMHQWIKLTVSHQFWRMFAQTGRASWSVIDLEVVLRGEHGEVFYIGDGMLGPDDHRVMDRRLKARTNLSKSERYRDLHARWVCRNFTLPDGGQDFTVELYRVVERMPDPEDLAELGVDRARERMAASRRSKLLHEHDCGE